MSVDANIVVFWDMMYKSRKLPGTWCHTTDNNDPNIYHCENLESHSRWCFQTYESINSETGCLLQEGIRK